MLGIYGLVAFVIATHGLAVEVGRKRDDACMFDYFGKTIAASPVEIHCPSVGNGFAACGRQGNIVPIDGQAPGQGLRFPFLVVADKTGP